MSFIRRFLEDLDIVESQKSRPVPLSAAPRARTWLPPEGEAVKFNCDGALSILGDKGAAAVICRDKSGKFLGASALVFEGLIDPASLEAHACSEALALARDLNVEELVIASDCLEVVTNINTRASPVYAPILHDIHTSMNLFSSVSSVWNVEKIISRPTRLQKELHLCRWAATCG